MITLKNISKRYKSNLVLNNVNLTSPADTISAIVGSNGAGKSTLLKIICGLVKPEYGQVRLQDRDISHLPAWQRIRSGLGYLSQASSLIQDLSVEDNIYLVPQKDTNDSEFRGSLLDQFGLNKLRKQKCKTLSGGEGRKVEFCRCMAAKPFCVLLDEPFSGLDPKTTAAIIQMIKDQHEKGIRFIIADHRIEELKKIAQHYVLLHKHKIAFNGEGQKFFSDTDVKRYFLGNTGDTAT